jgi:predicted DNA-binding transcriptional regulator AlpA
MYHSKISKEITPRLMRLPAVLEYMDVQKPLFDKHIRGKLTEVRLGYRTIAFEKDEVDRLIDSIKKGETSCQTNCRQDYSLKTVATKLTNDTNQPQATSLSEYKSLLGKPPRR